jgi:TRAP-type C4-dicarboxylate transport system permease small subunit
MQRFARVLRLALELVGGALLIGLTAVVVLAATLRLAGIGLSWYDEVAPILLTWVTYFGAALVALNRGHLGFDNIVRSLPPRGRRIAFVVSEVLTAGFFLALAWGGFRLMHLVSDEYLMTLPWFPSWVAQSVIPVASLLFVLSQGCALPQAWRGIVEEEPFPAAPDHLT